MSAPTPPWAQARGGAPEPGSPLDQQFAAFVGPRWGHYRRKFAPFFDDPRFQPTWNWAAALFTGMWFLYRKLYIPFLFFTIVPGIAVGLLWGDRPPPEVPATPAELGALPPELRDFWLIRLGILISTAVLAGGTANYLLFRRATAAMQLVAPREADLASRLPLLRRVGGVSWASVAIVLGIITFLLFLSASRRTG